MEKKTYCSPRIEAVELDAEATMVNTISDPDADYIIIDNSTINKGNAGQAASNLTINDVWE